MSYRGRVPQTTRILNHTPDNHTIKELKNTSYENPSHNPLRSHVLTNYQYSNRKTQNHHPTTQNVSNFVSNQSYKDSTEDYNSHYINNTPNRKTNEVTMRSTNNYSNTKEKFHNSGDNVSNYDTNITITRTGQSPSYANRIDTNPSAINPFKNPQKGPQENNITVRERQQYVKVPNNANVHTITVNNPSSTFRHNQGGSPATVKYRDVTPTGTNTSSRNVLHRGIDDKKEIKYVEKTPTPKYIEKPVEKIIYKEKIIEKQVKDEKLIKDHEELKLDKLNLQIQFEKTHNDLKNEKEKNQIQQSNNNDLVEQIASIRIENECFNDESQAFLQHIKKLENKLNQMHVDYSPNPLTKKFMNTELLKTESCFDVQLTGGDSSFKLDAQDNIELAKQLMVGQTMQMLECENLKSENENIKNAPDIIEINELSMEISRQAEVIINLEKSLEEANEYVDTQVGGTTKLMLEIEMTKGSQKIGHQNDGQNDSQTQMKLKKEYEILFTKYTKNLKDMEQIKETNNEQNTLESKVNDLIKENITIKTENEKLRTSTDRFSKDGKLIENGTNSLGSNNHQDGTQNASFIKIFTMLKKLEVINSKKENVLTDFKTVEKKSVNMTNLYDKVLNQYKNMIVSKFIR